MGTFILPKGQQMIQGFPVNKFATKAQVAGFGDTFGAASSTDNAVARFDGVTGKLIQNSLVTISDTGALSIPNDIALSLGTTLPYNIHNYQFIDGVWFEAQGGSGFSQFNLAVTFDSDKQVAFKYIHGTVGAGAGQLIFGQLAKNNANFTHGITSFYTNGVEAMRINITGGTLNTGYSRIGSLSAPTNTTAGDLTFVRGIATTGITIGTQTVATQALGVTGDVAATGYARIGSLTAPTNTTAGDLTVVRGIATTSMTVGTQTASTGMMSVGGNPSSLTAFHAGFTAAPTVTSGTYGYMVVQGLSSPGSNHSGANYTMYFDSGVAAGITANFTASPLGLIGVSGTSTHRGTGTITGYAAFFAQSPAVTNGGVITSAYGLYINRQKIASGVTNGFGVYQVDANDTNYFAGNIDIGNTSDTTLSRSAAGILAVEGIDIPTISSTHTFTNKRITPRIGTEASSATSTPTGDTVDQWNITALAAADAIAAPTGTPTDGQKLMIRIKDNGTARALTWNAIYRAGTDVALPTTTVISKTLYCGFIYNAADSKWDLVAVVNNI